MQRHLPRNESTLKLVQENKIFEGTVEFNTNWLNYKEIQKINTKANHTREPNKVNTQREWDENREREWDRDWNLDKSEDSSM